MAINYNYDNLQFIKKETLDSMAEAIRDIKPGTGTMTATEMVEEVAALNPNSGGTITPGTKDLQVAATGDCMTGNIVVKGDGDLQPQNIVEWANIFGVQGTYKGGADTPATATPQDIRKDETAWVNGAKITGTMPDTKITASGTASATTTVAPGTVTISHKPTSMSDKTQLVASLTTDTKEIDTYYMAVEATAAANTTGTTSAISGTATAKVDTAGYVSSDAEGNVTGTATAKTSKKSSSTYYIPVASGGCTVAGGGLSVNNNYSGTPTVDITLDGQTTSGVAITDTKPSSGYYLTVGANSSALSGSTKVTRAAVTDTHTAGYIPAKSATTVINSTSASPTVTVNAGSKTEYITIPSGGCTVSGGGLSGGSSVTPTVSISSGSDTNMSNVTVGSKDTTNYPYYFKVNGSSSSGSSTVSRAAIKDTHSAGYIPDKSATTVINSDSKTVTVNAGSGSGYVGMKEAVFGVAAAAKVEATVSPGTPFVITQVKPISGKQQKHIVATIVNSADAVDENCYYVPIRANAPSNSTTLRASDASGNASALVSTAGYAPVNLSSSSSVNISGEITTEYGYGNTQYLTMPAVSTNGVEIDDTTSKVTANVNVITAGYAPDGLLVSTELPEYTAQYSVHDLDITEKFINNPYVYVRGEADEAGWVKKGDRLGVILNEPDLRNENIVSGATILGLSGTHVCSDSLASMYDEEVYTNTAEYKQYEPFGATEIYTWKVSDASMLEVDTTADGYYFKLQAKKVGYCYLIATSVKGALKIAKVHGARAE